MAFTRLRLVFDRGGSGVFSAPKMDFSHVSADPTPAQLVAGAEAARNSAATGTRTWAEIAGAGYTLMRCTAQVMDFETKPVSTTYPYGRTISPVSVEQSSTGASLAGSLSTPASPAVSQEVAFKTALAGKRFRGRWYGPPPAEADVSASGAMTQANADENAEFTQQLADAFIASGSGLVFEAQVIPSLPTGILTEVTLHQGRIAVATQRPRQAYMG